MTGALDAIRLWAGLALGAAALVYLAGSLVAVRAWGRRRLRPAAHPPPVTVLKPLCGLEPGLYQNLRSFCDQDYPEFQVVFGVRDPADPALAVARRLIAEFPGRALETVADPRVTGGNLKAANLANMMAAARHDYLVIADADIRVGRDYLRQVVEPLHDPGVGVVTCLYRGRALGGLWSRLGALFINDGFLPSVLVARALGSSAFCFGSTMALRREALAAIGGFPALAAHLADDYMLGELTRRQGRRTVLSPYLVETLVHEPGLKSLLAHELRWMRTIRVLQPWGHAFSGITYGLPVSLAAAALAGDRPAMLALPLLALVLRVMLHYATRKSLHLSGPTTAWLIPLRDFLSFGIWLGSFFSRRVTWRQQEMSVQSDGRIRVNKE